MLGDIKRLVFNVAKYTGCFHLTRALYRKRIRVLCYHGFELENETAFQPKLFIGPVTFSQRMQYLKDKGYTVITLSEAVEAIRTGNIPDDAVVLTIDDGFYSVYSEAAPILQSLGFPATLYLTSYYFDRDGPIFSLAVRYLFWSVGDRPVDFTALAIPGMEDSAREGNRAACIDRIVEYGQGLDGNEGRVALLQRLAGLLDISYEQFNRSRVMGLINREELQGLLQAGVDIQLHTHRHDFPLDLAAAADELDRNREKVDPLLTAPMRHFCYPSGLWNEAQWALLEESGVESATTCLPGLLEAGSQRYAIPRFLDGSNISRIEFESEMAGFSEFCRLFKFAGSVQGTQ